CNALSGERPFLCHYCDSSFRFNWTRANHIRQIHKMQPYACVTCEMQFYTKYELRYHLLMNEHQSLDDSTEQRRAGQLFFSSKCGKNLDSQDNL
ncbi:hypothetical protein PMAYCL1PPCAC_01162, partial [Pristionchus mayeri]